MNDVPQRSNFRQAAILIALGLMVYTVGAVRAGDWSPDDAINGLAGDQNRQYVLYQPPHFYPYSAPRDLLNQWYDAVVPQMVSTWTVFGYDGLGPTSMCESRGYGLPWGAQITSPVYPSEQDNGHDANETVVLSQSDPDGMYADTANTSATIVLCNRGGHWVFEQHEEVVSTYTTPVHLNRLADGVHQEVVYDDGQPQIEVDVTAIDGKYQAPKQVQVGG